MVLLTPPLKSVYHPLHSFTISITPFAEHPSVWRKFDRLTL